MNNLTPKPESSGSSGPELIRDEPRPKADGKDIGELVGGQALPHDAAAWAAEEAHWRENHPSQEFASGRPYDEFGSAYRVGFEGYHRHRPTGKSFDETETELRERYETEDGSPKLPWITVRPASQAAWQRSAQNR